MLIQPFLAKCTDRNSLAKSHPSSGAPEDWLSNDILLQNGLFGITFDFFVNWSAKPPVITPIIWIKRILSSNYTYSEVIGDVANVLKNEFGLEYLNRVVSFSDQFSFRVELIIFRDDYNWSLPLSEVLIVTLSRSGDELRFQTKVINIEQLRKMIRSYSGGPIQIGSKGLIYGTSRLECYLSSTDSLYPGDVDLIVLNPNNRPSAILEFKKHTLATNIREQKLSNYYPRPDGRKYDRLELLREFISGDGGNVPLLVLYYPTNSAFTEGRLELLKGNTGHLATKATGNFLLPTDKSHDKYNNIVSKIVKAIEYHHNHN